MATKSMKGLLKGLRYISQIFDDDKKEEEEEEVEIEIGFPTDVKHVAHIGSEGPSKSDAPSWLNEFKSGTGLESTPIVSPASHRKDPRIKSTCEDSRGKRAESCQGRDLPDIPKSSRRNSLTDKSGDGSPKKKESKTKHSKRQNSKEYSEGDVKTTRKLQETSMTSNSPSRNLPDIPKKSRGRKSKELVSGGGSSKSRSKGDSNGLCTSQYSENGPDSDTILQISNPPRLSPIPNFEGGGKEYR